VINNGCTLNMYRTCNIIYERVLVFMWIIFIGIAEKKYRIWWIRNKSIPLQKIYIVSQLILSTIIIY